jgi:hypothetical protein
MNIRVIGRIVVPPYTMHTTDFQEDLSSSCRLVLVKFEKVFLTDHSGMAHRGDLAINEGLGHFD